MIKSSQEISSQDGNEILNGNPSLPHNICQTKSNILKIKRYNYTQKNLLHIMEEKQKVNIQRSVGMPARGLWFQDQSKPAEPAKCLNLVVFLVPTIH